MAVVILSTIISLLLANNQLGLDTVVMGTLLLLLLLDDWLESIIYGLIVIIIGTLPIFYSYNFIGFNIDDYPIFRYAILYISFTIYEELFKAGITEVGPLKYPEMIVSFILIATTLIPDLYSSGVINFYLDYPKIVDSILYIIAGILMIAVSPSLKE